MKFFRAIWAWIKAHIVLSAIIGGAVVVTLTLAIVLPITLSNRGHKSSSSQSQSTSSESSLPDAPVDKIEFSLDSFVYTDKTPTPTLKGLDAENIQIAYSYLDAASSARLGDYVPDVQNTIDAGSYKLKADVTTSTYKPFSLTADFTISKATFAGITLTSQTISYDGEAHTLDIAGELPVGSFVEYTGKGPHTNAGVYPITATVTNPNYNTLNLDATLTISKAAMPVIEMTISDYFFDQVKPTPNLTGVPMGSNVEYKYYTLPESKEEYVPGEQNNIIPGVYTLEATVTNPNYEGTAVVTYDFVVKTATFNAPEYQLNTTDIDIGELDINYNLDLVALDDYLHMNRNGQKYLGVSFTWKQHYEIVGGIPLNATIVANATGFYNKEYTINVSSDKKVVQEPSLYRGSSGSTPIGNWAFDNTEKTVHADGEDFATYCEVVEEQSILSATEAGTYSVTVALKDPDHTCWPNGTSGNINIQWVIAKRTIFIPYLSQQEFTYDGNLHDVEVMDLDEDYAVLHDGTLKATSAGEYNVHFDLVYPDSTQWTDHTNTTQTLTWRINAIALTIPTLYRSSYSYNLDKSATVPELINFDEDYMVATGDLSATDVGDYTITVSLTNPNTKWSDGTTAPKELNWEITPLNPWGSSEGARLTVGEYVGDKSTQYTIPLATVLNPVELKIEFDHNGVWDLFEDAVFETNSEEYAHFDGDGKLVVDNPSETIDIVVRTPDNPNYIEIHSTYNLTFVAPSSRSITFDKDHVSNSYYGWDENEVKTYSSSTECPLANGLFAIVNGFELINSFKSIDRVTVTFLFTTTTEIQLSAYFTDRPGTYIGGIFQKNKVISESGSVEFDFTDCSFDPEEDYYLKFWHSSGDASGVIVTSIVVEYTVE